MDRTERLLDLVALLLDAREPISWAELREQFPADYGGISDDAAERKFERDKAELLELGLPLTYIQGDDDRKDGYIVDRSAYYLPEVDLSKEELAVLYAAGSASLASGAFPGSDDLAHALRKIGFFAGDALPTPRVRMELGSAQSNPELSARLEQLWEACAAHKYVQIAYASPKNAGVTDRRVDPYGLALRRGVWTLVGYCHLRQGLRTFHIQRIREMKVNPSKPRTPDFEVPADFSLDAYVAYYPWQHRFHEPMEVTLLLRGEASKRAASLFPGATVEPTEQGVRAKLNVTFLDGLLRFCLALGPDCRVESPEAAVTRVREMATRIHERHSPTDEKKVSA
ncbi:helix-turn-helix transcriptional regulator [Hyalangium rubrum]|uniref:WYL domain-containing protein n=1 Tax=Hyalangium rubrum TaxID=3103134 RepID=A0ABU5HG82_9BACT|nr:WYL domain-containing protein [Hyalangium sp. s54d21]MDY7231838.1 WYL domain-containing protein [Hyalangium sp. s54d21]